jgi:hypothetical protein
MDDMQIELPRSIDFACEIPARGGSITFADTLSWLADDEPNVINAARCRRPRWLWLGCIAFAFWAGLGFAIHALIVAVS